VVEQPKDTDGDGVLDKEDACPDVAGLKIFKGCPDTDGDGVADKDDACPAAPGPKVFNGCPDSDGDGIADKDDKCAYVPGIAKYGGCPVPDKDKDGIPDEEDNCPEVAGVAVNKGCPEIQVDAIRKVAVAAQNILFTPGKATLLKQSNKPLNDVIDILNQYPDLKLNIEGHTDNTGDAAKNQALSQARAEAVKTYMAAKGIAESRMTANGFGQDKPSADNKTAAGRAKNRRVELKLEY
jgi:OmpA-OmpF porin, OOP family